jgi:hypothetical protein
MANQNIKKFYQHSNKQYYYLPHAVGNGAPTTIPEDAGLMYIDVDSQTIYVSAGRANVSDWKVINGGSGSGPVLQTNGTNNDDQSILNLLASTGISLTNDPGTGDVNIGIDDTYGKKIYYVDSTVTISTDGAGTYVSTGAGIPIEINNVYSFRAVIAYNVSTTTIGLAWAVDNTADPVPFALNYYSFGSSSAANQFGINTGNSAFNEPAIVPGQTAKADGNVAIIEGVYYASQPGNLNVTVRDDGTFSQNVTIVRGSYIEYIKRV